MNKAAPKRAFSLAMIVAVLSTSILACAFTPKNTDEPRTDSSNQQLPFEENENEFEDKDEADEKSDGFGISLYLIDEIFSTAYITTSVVSIKNYSSKNHLPLFLTYHRFLI
jgi:hypothetical protein